jgi:hypothetical protein
LNPFEILRRSGSPPAAPAAHRQPIPIVLALACFLAASVPTSVKAAVLPWMDLAQMTSEAEIIALGRVESAASAWSEDGRTIVTRATVAIEKTLKGGPRSTVVIETPGGKVGDQIMVASSAPVFSAGERVVVFLSRTGQPGRLGVVGWNLGKMEVRRDARTGRDLVRGGGGGAVYLDPWGKRIHPERMGAGPVELGQFLKQVEDLVARDGRDVAP